MGKPRHWCRTCAYCIEYRKNIRMAICTHIIIKSLAGRFPIYEHQNCVLWEKRRKEEKG